jgi:ribosomal protein S18 acetylase RimI-like enzyme
MIHRPSGHKTAPTGGTINIRYFEERDRDEVIVLWKACGLVVPWNDPAKDIGRKLAFQKDLFLVAVENGAPVGTVMAGYDGHRGWINYLAVAPDRRNRGLGRALMEEAENRLRALGCPKICLQVRRTNAGVVEFYGKLGFIEDDVLSMGKRLESDDAEGRE